MDEPAEQVRVLVVDDQRPFRAAAAAVLRRTPGFELVGDAETGEAAVEQLAALQPDLVLMDINMPGIGGVEATRRVVEQAPGTVVFLCSTYQREDLPADASTSGADTYLHKEELRPDLLTALWERARRARAGGLTPPAAPSPG
jgi:DNA-binding NarL/FixJ family response regulator